MKKKYKKLWMLLLVMLGITLCSVTASAASTVAKIGSKKYSSLQSAVNNVKNGQTIKLQKDLKLSKTIYLSRKVSFTLDLNKHKISYGGNETNVAIGIDKGSVTIKNGSIIGLKKEWVGAAINVEKGAKLYIKSGTYKNVSVENWGGTVSITGGTYKITLDPGFDSLGLLNYKGKMTLSGITFTSSVQHGYIQNGHSKDSASLTIKSGTYKATGKNSIYLVDNRGETSSSKVSILGGTYTYKGTVGAALANSGTNAVMTIKNAKCTSNTTCINNRGTMTVSGGTFTSKRPGYANAVLVASGNSKAPSKTTITGGTFTATGEVINPYVLHSEPFAIISGAYDRMYIKGGKILCPQKPAEQAVINVHGNNKSFVCKVNVIIYDERK